MQPTYTTLTASGSGPWKVVNWHVTPINIGVSVTNNSSSTWQIDYCADDPSGAFPNPVLGSSGVTVYSTTSGSSQTVYATLTTPIAAIRLTMNALSSAGAKVTASFLQSGIA
jgi:hypothetical protein